MPTDTYDPAQILASFAGNPIIGYAPGTFLSIERNEDAFMLQVGSDGETARARNNNKSGTIKLTLMQSSPTNDILDALAEADELTGAGVGPFFMKDNLGTALVSAPNTWVKKRATIEYGNQLATREWVLETDFLGPMHVGSTT